MAEVYGEKPKLFSKEWWPYYWMYYKWHTIILFILSIAIVVSISECSKKVSPDLGIVYCTESYYAEAEWENLVESLSNEIADINDDEEQHIKFMSIEYVDDEKYAEQNYAMGIKYVTSFSEKTNYIYICDKKTAETIVLADDKNIPFQPVDNWLNTDTSDYEVIYGTNKQIYAVSLKNSKILEVMGIKASDLFIMIKSDEGSPYKDEQAFKNAVILANILIK